jgi:hypothetical protein
MFHQGRILYTSLVSLIMTIICLDPCQWSLMSLITGNKVCPLSALSLDEGLNALSGKNPSGCWLVQPTNQMSDISAYAH